MTQEITLNGNEYKEVPDDPTRDTVLMIGNILDDAFNGKYDAKKPKWGFAVLVFPFEGDDKTLYISNTERSSAISVMKQWLHQITADELPELNAADTSQNEEYK